MKLTRLEWCPVPGCDAYRSSNNLVVICGQEPCGPHGEILWHLSVSHNKRNPTWEEIRDLRYLLVPEQAMMAMFLPPRDQYVNAHRYCFHMYQVERDQMPKSVVMP